MKQVKERSVRRAPRHWASSLLGALDSGQFYGKFSARDLAIFAGVSDIDVLKILSRVEGTGGIIVASRRGKSKHYHFLPEARARLEQSLP